MSGTQAQPLLTDAEKVDVRRYCGYPTYGAGASDDTFNRFDPVFETLEYRMANLQDAELIVCRAKLAQLATLDGAFVSMSGTLGVAIAASFTRNASEGDDRSDLYRQRRRDLCEFFGIPLGAALRGRSSISLIV